MRTLWLQEDGDIVSDLREQLAEKEEEVEAVMEELQILRKRAQVTSNSYSLMVEQASTLMFMDRYFQTTRIIVLII
jgi:thymidylate kinase